MNNYIYNIYTVAIGTLIIIMNNSHTFTNAEQWVCARNYVKRICRKYEQNNLVACIINKQYQKTIIYVFKIMNTVLQTADISSFQNTNDIEYKTLGKIEQPSQFKTMSIIRHQIQQTLEFDIYISYKNDFYYNNEEHIWKNIDNNNPLVISKKVKDDPIIKKIKERKERVIKSIHTKRECIKKIQQKLSAIVYENTSTEIKLKNQIQKYNNSIIELSNELFSINQELQVNNS